MPTPKLVLIIGGTGAQGIPVIKTLTADYIYSTRVLTRSSTTPEARLVASFPNTSLFVGETYHEPTLRLAFRDVTHVFANTNSFAIGEKNEIYWGIRLYELARKFGVQHFIWAGLDYASALGNFDVKYRTGHLDGKAKVSLFLNGMGVATEGMKWSVLSSCPYIEGLGEVLRPEQDENGIWVWKKPIGDGKMPFIYLEDYGLYARWMFDNPARSNGMNLHAATEDISFSDLAKTFTEVTGQKAAFRDVSLDQFFATNPFPPPEMKLGHSAQGEETLVTVRENFSGFWNVWRDGLTSRDYKLLDDILPGRVKSVKEWMVKTGYTAEFKPVLKDWRDMASSVQV